MDSLKKAEALYTSIGVKLGQANVLISEGDIQHNRGHYGEALLSYSSASDLYQQEKYTPGRAEVLLKLGDLYCDQAYWQVARKEYEDASRFGSGLLGVAALPVNIYAFVYGGRFIPARPRLLVVLRPPFEPPQVEYRAP